MNIWLHWNMMDVSVRKEDNLAVNTVVPSVPTIGTRVMMMVGVYYHSLPTTILP